MLYPLRIIQFKFANPSQRYLVNFSKPKSENKSKQKQNQEERKYVNIRHIG